MPPIELRLGDVLILRKPHPCGNSAFVVVRLGADIGLRCQTCQRRILLARTVLARRIVRFASHAPEREMPSELEPPLAR